MRRRNWRGRTRQGISPLSLPPVLTENEQIHAPQSRDRARRPRAGTAAPRNLGARSGIRKRLLLNEGIAPPEGKGGARGATTLLRAQGKLKRLTFAESDVQTLRMQTPSPRERLRLSQEERSRLGSEIARLRRVRDWSQAQLARRTRLHPSRLSRIEHGQQEPLLGELFALAQALGVGVTELLRGSQPAGEPEHASLLNELRELMAPEERAAVSRVLVALVTGLRCLQPQGQPAEKRR